MSVASETRQTDEIELLFMFVFAISTEVNICPKKSETVYPPIRRNIMIILKLSVLLNQEILKQSIKIFKQSQKHNIKSAFKQCFKP